MYNKDEINKIIDKNICILSRYSHAYADEKLKKFQLNKTQGEIVLFIYENDNLSLAEINRYFLRCCRLMAKKSTTFSPDLEIR